MGRSHRHGSSCSTNHNHTAPPTFVLPPWARVSVPRIVPVEDDDDDDDDNDDTTIKASRIRAHQEDDAYLRTRAYHAVAQRIDQAAQRAWLETAPSLSFFPNNNDAEGHSSLNEPQQPQPEPQPQSRESFAPASSTTTTDAPAGPSSRSSSNPSILRARDNDDESNHCSDIVAETTSSSGHKKARRTFSSDNSTGMDYFTLPDPPASFEPMSSSRQNNPWTDLLLPLTVLEGPWDHRDRAACMTELVVVRRRHDPRTVYWPCRRATGGSQPQQWAKILWQRIRSAAAAAADTTSHNNNNHNNNNKDITIVMDGDPPDDFWPWCADRRANHGWPLRVVWMRPPHHSHPNRSPFQSSATQSAVGWRVQTVVLPTAEQVLKRLQQELLQDNVILEYNTNLARSVHHVFVQQSRSVVHVVQQLKRWVAEQLSVPGAWWCLAHQFLVLSHARRITALLLDAPYRAKPAQTPQPCSATAMLEWLVSVEVRRQLLDTVQKVQTILIHKYYSGNGNVLPLVGPTIMHPPTATTMDHNLTDEDRRILLQPVAQAYSKTNTHPTALAVYALSLCPTDRDLPQRLVHDKLTQALHQLLVGLDQCITAGQVQHLLTELLRRQTPRTVNSHHYDDNNNDDTTENGLPQPRRDIVTALLDDFEHDDNDNDTHASSLPSSEIHIPGQLYRLLLDRTTIEQGEWFRAWVTATRRSEHTADWQGAFGCGVRHLQLLGLIRPRFVAGRRRGGATTTTTTSTVWFEKTALVWCGGES